MLLDGFGFSGYRNFSNDLVKIAPLQKINLIIGQNNSGKSNIISFLEKLYPYYYKAVNNRNQNSFIKKQEESPFDMDLDNPKPIARSVYKVAFPLHNKNLEEYIDKVFQGSSLKSLKHTSLAKTILQKCFLNDGNFIWSVFSAGHPTGAFMLDIDTKKIKSTIDNQDWHTLWNGLTGMRGGASDEWISTSINKLTYIPSKLPDIKIIPAIRRVGASGSEALDFSGEGIIDRLAKLQNPVLTSQKDKEKFKQINCFVQEVLENSTIEIDIPHDRSMVLVHMDDKTLPLESLGTGIHEVVIIAAAATILEDTVICIEEPELHLHSLLQKKLINYLSSETNNQYIFTTHSAHLLDAVDAEILHVSKEDNESVVNLVASTKQKSNICNELGYKASDILQSNCIIWVEGPSDRIYINHWLHSKQANLVEGIHYSIMFYGGRLFSHLTALDNDVEIERINDFICLRNLNRNAVIVFDSDKENSKKHLNNTKKRLQNEFDQGPGFTWVTKGREIENYLEEEKLKDTITDVHPDATVPNSGSYANLLNIKSKRGNDTKGDKVKIAHTYIKKYSEVNFSILDLDSKVNQLVAFIKKINNI